METTHGLFLTDVMDLMLDAVCVVDRAGRFVFVSAAFERLFGYAPAEIIGRPMLDLVFAEDRDKTLQTVDSLIAGEVRPIFENRWVHKSGRVVHVMWSARWSEQHQVRIAVARDVTEQKRMEEQLRQMAQHDSLTNLPNRALLQDRLQVAFAHARRNRSQLCLLFIDLDDFKQVNDSHGHLVGDRLLQSVAERLRGCLREADTAARIGGDEFVVLSDAIPAAEAAVHLAEKIRAVLAQPYDLADISVCVSPSIGIALYPEHGEDYQALFKRADAAMYRAKTAGGNRSQLFYLFAAKDPEADASP